MRLQGYLILRLKNMNNGPLTSKYVVDTNTLIGFSIWNPISLNKVFWEKLELSLKEGKWILLDVVYKEVTHNGPLKEWCKKQKQNGLVVEISEDDKLSAIEINNNYPMVDSTTFKSGGDPYIVAYALNNKIAVFTREIYKTPIEKLFKIPDVCQILSIKCTKKPEEFLESISFKN